MLLGAGASIAQKVTILPDLPYTTDGTGTYRADLYLPPSPDPHPAIVAIHGGSWRSGHKTELRHLCADLARQGFACFSIDYDTRRHSFPVSWQESRDAVQYLRAHALEYHLDPARVAVLGTSAGGQLAALLALAPQGPAAADMPHPADKSADGSTPQPGGGAVPVSAAVLFNGGYDLHPRHWLLRRYLGADCSAIPEICNDASPDFHVHPGAPPIFVGHGTHDHLIPYSQATTFIGLLESAHDPVTPFAAENAPHSYWRKRRWYRQNLSATENFLQRSLPGRGREGAEVATR
jgi:acetyl esterase/lipase